MSRYFIILVLFIVVALPSKAAHEAADSTAVTQPADSLSRTLDEVVVEAETIKRDGNHDIITITREMRKNSFNTAQMLGKIPGMHVDYSRNTLVSRYYPRPYRTLLRIRLGDKSSYTRKL